MKQIIIRIFIFLGSVYAASGQTNLSFRFADPRVIRTGGYDHFEFDIQVRASEPGTYLWSGQAILYFNNSTLSQVVSQWSVSRGEMLTGQNSAGNSKYILLKSITGTAPAKVMNIGWTGDVQVATNGPNQQDFNEVPVEYITLVTVSGRITDETGMAGIYFRQVSMDGQQFMCGAGNPYCVPYQSPNSYDTLDLMDIYTGRIYSSGKGWSQTGNLVNEQWVDWTATVNTSVWDTNQTAATVGISGAMAGALHIHPGAQLTLPPGTSLTCAGSTLVSQPDGISIEADSTGTGSFIDNGEIAYSSGGSVRLEKLLKTGQWTGFCLPVTSLSTGILSQVSLKYRDEASQTYRFVPVPPLPDTTLAGHPFRGYFATPVNGLNSEMTISGSLLSGEVTSIPVTRTDPDSILPLHGYTLLGNPYASSLELGTDSVIWDACEKKAWFFNADGSGNYEVFIPGAAGTHSGIIPPMQSFFVRRSESGSTPAQLTLNNFCRTHETSANPDTTLFSDRLILQALSINQNISDVISIHFRVESTPFYDELFDADKLQGSSDVPSLSSIAGTRPLAVQALPWTGMFNIVPLGFIAPVPGNYRFHASSLSSFGSEKSVFLEDQKLNVFRSLKMEPEYSFLHEPADDPARFRLHFTNNAVPSLQSSDIQFLSSGEDRFTFNWTDGNGSGRVVFISQDTTGLPQPGPEENYIPDTVFGQGSRIGSTGWFCVFKGSAHPDGVTVTSLNAGTSYRVMVCEFRENEGLFIYNQSPAFNNPAGKATCPVQYASVTGPGEACHHAGNLIYSTQPGMTDYNWTAIGGNISYAADSSSVGITWNRAGVDSVIVTWQDPNGCMSRPAFKTISVLAAPDTIGTIAGPANVCIGSPAAAYYISPAENSDYYSWTLSPGITLVSGEGTDSINVIFPDSTAEYWLSVRGVNSCFQGENSSGKRVLVYCPDSGQIIHGNVIIPAFDSLHSSGGQIRTAGSGQYFIVDSNGFVNLAASQNIKLLPGTRVFPGGFLLAQLIPGCLPCDNLKMTSVVLLTGSNTENGNQPEEGEPFAKVYPNPFNNGFTVDLHPAPDKSDGSIMVYNNLGVKIHSASFNRESRIYVPLSGANSGMYMVVVSQKESIFSAKIFKY